jgi:hypothetical protein
MGEAYSYLVPDEELATTREGGSIPKYASSHIKDVRPALRANSRGTPSRFGGGGGECSFIRQPRFAEP